MNTEQTDDDQEPSDSPDSVFLTAVVFETFLGGLALVLGWIIGPDARDKVPDLDLQQLQPLLEGLGYGLLAAVPILLFIKVVERLPFEAVRKLESVGSESIVATMLKLSYAELVVISLCAGVGEELLFRGWLMPWMIGTKDPTAIHNIAIGLIGSSIAFGLVHPITRLYVFLAFVMVLYFGGLLLWTDNLLVPIVAHAAYDAVQLIMARRRPKLQTA